MQRHPYINLLANTPLIFASVFASKLRTHIRTRECPSRLEPLTPSAAWGIRPHLLCPLPRRCRQSWSEGPGQSAPQTAAPVWHARCGHSRQWIWLHGPTDPKPRPPSESPQPAALTPRPVFEKRKGEAC